MGVESKEPKVPPFVMVKLPPVRSSMTSFPSRDFFANFRWQIRSQKKTIDHNFEQWEQKGLFP